MSLDRPTVKANSRQLIREAKPSVLTASLILIVLGVVITMLSNRLTGISVNDAMRYLRYLEDGNAEAAFNIVLSNTPSAGAQFISFLLNCVSIIVALGFTIFLLNTLRNTERSLGNLLDGFGLWWKVLLLDIVCGIFVFLWSLLLVVPGIVAGYRYSMVNYILINNPDMGIMDCIRESKRLTQGHKGELFMLDLSFIGWGLLTIVPVLGWFLLVWLRPYQELSKLQYFEAISGYTVTDDSAADTPLYY